jgi:flagellar motor switch protein FliG
MSAAPMSDRPEKRAEKRAEKRSGTERAAILLLTLGEQEAAQVLKHMGAKEVQRVGAAMAHLAHVSRDEVRTILTDFSALLENQTSVGVGVDEFLRKVLVDALGQEKASSVIERINIGQSSKGLEALKWMDSRAVAELIRQEHPQIIAIVLAYLEADQSAEILQQLPGPLRAEVVMRIAQLDGVQPTALSELDDVMEKQFAGKSAGKTSVLGGAKAAAEIVNFLDPSMESALMEQIATADQALATRIQDLIFVFDNLIDLDDRSMQELLRQVPSDKLLIALKGADETLKQKIFKNMSQRAAEMLRDDLEARGPVRLSEVEAAQKEILATARKLAEAGTIAIAGKGEEYV